MDMQYVGNQFATAAYVASYMTKAESEGLRQAVGASLAALPEGSDLRQRYDPSSMHLSLPSQSSYKNDNIHGAFLEALTIVSRILASLIHIASCHAGSSKLEVLA